MSGEIGENIQNKMVRWELTEYIFHEFISADFTSDVWHLIPSEFY
jgi:hypothetical protein